MFTKVLFFSEVVPSIKQRFPRQTRKCSHAWILTQLGPSAFEGLNDYRISRREDKMQVYLTIDSSPQSFHLTSPPVAPRNQCLFICIVLYEWISIVEVTPTL